MSGSVVMNKPLTLSFTVSAETLDKMFGKALTEEQLTQMEEYNLEAFMVGCPLFGRSVADALKVWAEAYNEHLPTSGEDDEATASGDDNYLDFKRDETAYTTNTYDRDASPAVLDLWLMRGKSEVEEQKEKEEAHQAALLALTKPDVPRRQWREMPLADIFAALTKIGDKGRDWGHSIFKTAALTDVGIPEEFFKHLIRQHDETIPKNNYTFMELEPIRVKDVYNRHEITRWCIPFWKGVYGGSLLASICSGYGLNYKTCYGRGAEADNMWDAIENAVKNCSVAPVVEEAKMVAAC